MKFTIPRDRLAGVLALMHRAAAPKNSPIPIIANLRLVASRAGVEITGTDLDIEMLAGVPADVAEVVGVTVPAAALHDIAAKLPAGGDIIVEETANQRLAVRSGRSRFLLPTLPVVDFPAMSVDVFACSFTIAAPALARLLARTSFAISTEETRYYLNGVFLCRAARDGAPLLRAVATDGHRLAMADEPLPDFTGELASVIVPRKTVGEVRRLGSGAASDLEIAVNRAKIRFTAGDIVLTSKLIDGTFPDYARVVPTGNDKVATLDRLVMLGALERCAIVASERGRGVKLEFTDHLALSVKDMDGGDACEEVDADYDAPPVEIGFNARYLAEELGAIEGARVVMRIADPGSPALFSPADDDSHLLVLMPMRV